jgi:hypothetical protein
MLLRKRTDFIALQNPASQLVFSHCASQSLAFRVELDSLAFLSPRSIVSISPPLFHSNKRGVNNKNNIIPCALICDLIRTNACKVVRPATFACTARSISSVLSSYKWIGIRRGRAEGNYLSAGGIKSQKSSLTCIFTQHPKSAGFISFLKNYLVFVVVE